MDVVGVCNTRDQSASRAPASGVIARGGQVVRGVPRVGLWENAEVTHASPLFVRDRITTKYYET